MTQAEADQLALMLQLFPQQELSGTPRRSSLHDLHKPNRRKHLHHASSTGFYMGNRNPRSRSMRHGKQNFQRCNLHIGKSLSWTMQPCDSCLSSGFTTRYVYSNKRDTTCIKHNLHLSYLVQQRLGKRRSLLYCWKHKSRLHLRFNVLLYFSK